jgi:glucan phosphoethanolaminetransferase (alkaline phosphatase superfamily)
LKKLIVLPLFLIAVDVYLRSDFLAFYKSKQLIHYGISVLVSLACMLLVQSILVRIKDRKVLFYAIASMYSGYILIAFVASVIFFYFNGFFPNYYTLEYFRTEPQSALVLLRDSTNLNDGVIFLLCGALLLVLFRTFRTDQFSKNWRFLLIGSSGIYLAGLSYLVYEHKRFDQCYMMDTNFVASVIRHVGEVGKDRSYKGNGLGSRNPYRLVPLAEKKSMNVLVIVCESLRKKNLGPYGYSKNTTPFLDRFKKSHPSEVFVFADPYTVSSTTMLAVPAVLSGIGPYQSPEIFYAQPLLWDFGRAAGLRTFFLSSHTMQWYRFDKYYANEKIDFTWNKDKSDKPFFNDLGVDDKYTIEQLMKQLDAPDPFFGVVQLNATHYPYKVPENCRKWEGSFEDEYNNSIAYQDSLLGMVFHQLEKKGKLRNTLIVFTSDHGESLKDHNNIGHVDSYYRETISVPLVFFVPKEMQNSLEMNSFRKNKFKTVSTIDVAPTIAQFLGFREQLEKSQIWSNYTGYSLLDPVPHDRCVITMNNNSFARFRVGLSVVGEGWHYLHRMNRVPHRQELYFYKKDPNESLNLFGRAGKKTTRRFLHLLGSYPTCEKYLPE